MGETSQTILIIEDDERLGGLFRDWLSVNGYETEHVSCGREGLERLSSSTPLLHLDVMNFSG